MKNLRANDRKQINDIVTYGGGALLAMAAMTIPWMMFQGGGVEFLSVDSPDRLKEALFGPEPWVVSCYNASETVQPYLNKAAVKLAKTDIKVGVVDCYSKTSSGKILAKRIGLKRSKYLAGGKKLFFTGNGRKLNEIGANTARTPESIFAWANPLAALKIYRPATTAQFVKQCLKKSTCLAVVSDEKLEGYDLQAIKDVAAAHRSVSFALVTSKQAELQNTDLKMEGAGPYVQTFFKPEKGAKTDDDKKINTQVLDYTGAFTAAALGDFLNTAAAAAATPVTRAVILKTKTDPEAAKKKAEAAKKKRARKKARDAARKAARKDKKPSPKPKARPAPRKKVSIQDEREARRKMDEEMSNMLVDNEPAEEEAAGSGADADADAFDDADEDDEADADDGEEMVMEEMGGDEDDEYDDEDAEEIEEEEIEEEEIEEEEEE